MTRIMNIPYNLTDPLDLYIVVFDGQIFIDFDNELEMNRKIEQEQRLKQTNTPEKYEYIKNVNIQVINLKLFQLFQNLGVKLVDQLLNHVIRK